MKYIQYDPAEFDKITVAKADDVDALKARIAELEAALKPFADITDQEAFKEYESAPDEFVMVAGNLGFRPDLTFALGDLRAARAALGEKE